MVSIDFAFCTIASAVEAEGASFSHVMRGSTAALQERFAEDCIAAGVELSPA